MFHLLAMRCMALTLFLAQKMLHPWKRRQMKFEQTQCLHSKIFLQGQKVRSASSESWCRLSTTERIECAYHTELVVRGE